MLVYKHRPSRRPSLPVFPSPHTARRSETTTGLLTKRLCEDAATDARKVTDNSRSEKRTSHNAYICSKLTARLTGLVAACGPATTGRGRQRFIADRRGDVGRVTGAALLATLGAVGVPK